MRSESESRMNSLRPMPFCTAASVRASTMTCSPRTRRPSTSMRLAARSWLLAAALTSNVSTSGSSTMGTFGSSSLRSSFQSESVSDEWQMMAIICGIEA